MPRPRRTRYTVYLTSSARGYDNRPVVVLAHPGTEDRIRDYYVARGYKVEKIVKGDMVSKAKRDLGSTEARWKLDPKGLDEAIAFFDLKWPIDIKATHHAGGRYGAHIIRSGPGGGPTHHITVKRWLSPEEAGRTLWHELCHAMQTERCAARKGVKTFFDVNMAWRSAPERAGSYLRRPIEIEARSYEEYNDAAPLAKAI